ISVPVGTFPLEVSIVGGGEFVDIIFMRILFSSAPVTKWELVEYGEQYRKGYHSDLVHLLKGSKLGLRIFGCLTDESAFRILEGKSIYEHLYVSPREVRKESITDFFEDITGLCQIFDNYREDVSFILFKRVIGEFYGGRSGNYPLYPSYVGYDEKGEICRFVVDLEPSFWRAGKLRIVTSEEQPRSTPSESSNYSGTWRGGFQQNANHFDFGMTLTHVGTEIWGSISDQFGIADFSGIFDIGTGEFSFLKIYRSGASQGAHFQYSGIFDREKELVSGTWHSTTTPQIFGKFKLRPETLDNS
ncbi:MAG: DUF4241 domain-containing protein, partial [Candidatus Hodarchaeota archaeon]